MIRAAIMTLLVGGLVALLVRLLHRPLWERRWVRRALVALVVVAPFGALLRGLGVGLFIKSFSDPYVAAVGALFQGGGAVLLLAVLLSLPFATLTRWLGGWVLARRAARSRETAAGESNVDAALVDAAPEAIKAEAGTPEIIAPEASAPEMIAPAAASAALAEARVTGGLDLSRREVLERAVLVAPALFTGTAALGIGGAFVDTAVHTRRLSFPSLAPELEGLRILQISDLHLGAFITRGGVTELVEKGREAKPDLVVLTGDICDYLPWLDFALQEIETIEAPLGHFAVMGNHEYYRGAKATRAAYAKSKVRMLDDAHTTLAHRGRKILLAGVDDPMGWKFKDREYDERADMALASAPSDADFKLALCHRPSGFRALAARGMDLTLSGHTHGAQAGVGGRSVLEPFLPEMQLWGEYRRGESALYTSSGAGHWATFRLGCPSEAPVIELVSG